MTIMIKEWWLDNDVELKGKVQPPIGPSVSSVQCCIDLTCTVGKDGQIMVQRCALARGMKRNKYNVSCQKAGQWLADQHCEMSVNQALRSNFNQILASEPALKEEILKRRVSEAVASESKPVVSKKGGLLSSLVKGLVKLTWGLVWLIVSFAVKLVRLVINSFSKK